jgi:uncharacterized protein
MQRVQRIDQHVREVMSQTLSLDLKLAHDFKHVDRVRKWALYIAQQEGFVNLELVEATALLHDIGLAYVDHRRDHACVGAEYATQFLSDNHLFIASEITLIADAIRAHSSLNGGGILGTFLRDADMLDLFGAVGIMRAFTSKYMLPEYDPLNITGDTWGLRATDFTQRFSTGMRIGPYIVDQLNFQLSCYDNICTASAKAIARPLVEFMQVYLRQLETEIMTTEPQAVGSQVDHETFNSN